MGKQNKKYSEWGNITHITHNSDGLESKCEKPCEDQESLYSQIKSNFTFLYKKVHRCLT